MSEVGSDVPSEVPGGDPPAGTDGGARGDEVEEARQELDHLAGQLDWVAERLAELDHAAAEAAGEEPTGG